MRKDGVLVLRAHKLEVVDVVRLAEEAGIELDINPLLADHEGIIAVDAPICVQRFDRPAASRLSIRPTPASWKE